MTLLPDGSAAVLRRVVRKSRTRPPSLFAGLRPPARSPSAGAARGWETWEAADVSTQIATTAAGELPAENPFAAASDLPYGLPPFDRIHEEHYGPAFEAGMASQRREVEAVAGDAAEPTFANTVEALERSGALLTRVANVFFNLTSSHVAPGL